MLFVIKAIVAFIQEAKYDYKKKKSMTSKEILTVVVIVGSLFSLGATIHKTVKISASLKEQKAKVAELEGLLKSKNQCTASSDSGKSTTEEGYQGLTIPVARTDCLSPYCLP